MEFDDDDADVFGFPIGRLVREKWHNSQSSGLSIFFKARFLVLKKKIWCKFVQKVGEGEYIVVFRLVFLVGLTTVDKSKLHY